MPVPLRVALPGSIKETCRLCAKPLPVSLDNPQRRCAACGEVNLPAPEFPPAAPAVVVDMRAMVRFLLRGAGSPLLAGILGFISASKPRGFDVLEWIVAVPLMGIPLSLLSALWLGWTLRRSVWKGQRLFATGAWLGGWFVAATSLIVLLSSGLLGWLTR